MIIDLYSCKNIILKLYNKLTINIIKYKFLIMYIYIFLKNMVNIINVYIIKKYILFVSIFYSSCNYYKSESYFYLSRII